MSDHYKTLGVEKSATMDEIKKAYRKKAKEHHPDTGGDEEEFKRVNNAYEVLGDPRKREEYDSGGSFRKSAFDDPFMSASRAYQWENFRNSNTNIQENIGVPLKVMISGGNVRVPLRVPVERNDGMSKFMFNLVTVIVPLKLEPNTPVGKRHVLSASEHGIEGVHELTLVVFPEKPSPREAYVIDNIDIHAQVEVDVFDSMFGNEVEVDLPTGKSVLVNLPEGIDTGKSIRLAGQGLTSVHGHQGDIYLVVSLKMSSLDPSIKDKIFDLIHPKEG